LELKGAKENQMLSFIPFQNYMIDDLVEFLTYETWPFHGQPNPTEESVRTSFQKGVYTENGNQTFWITESNEKIGMIRLFDLDDPTCLFDIRLKHDFRGNGLGVHILKLLTDHVFLNYSDIIRIEGHTRSDNFAMRKTFFKSGFVKEAYHRQAWPQEGQLFDSVGYAMLRGDWENKTITEINDKFAY
jgi:RimJ/RimL family protein N-acetyltransferase